MPTPKKKSEKNKKAALSKDPNMLYVDDIEGKGDQERKAILSHSPTVRATFGGKAFGDILLAGGDLTQGLKTLRERVNKIQDGDMAGVEEILVAQADTLDTVFNAILMRAMCNQTHLQHFEGLMRIAMKAQAQCSLTLRTLAEIKNPRQGATFVRQMNNANQQVVNNNLAGAQETGKKPNELSEGRQNVEALGQGGAPEAIEAHPRMDALEEIHRAQDGRREAEIVSKRLEGRG